MTAIRHDTGQGRGSDADPSTPLLEVRDLRVQFHSRHGTVNAIDGIDLQIGRGEIVALVGESGSGKSMTALSVARILPAAAKIAGGEVLLDGQDLLQLSEREMNGVRGSRIAMLFQQPKASLDPTSRVGDQVAEAYRFHHKASKRQASQRAVELLADVGIPEPARRARAYRHQLSGGMAQRVMIAAALSGHPELLIADEPTTALDVTVQAQILRLLIKMSRENGLSILLITHDLSLVTSVANRVYVMYAGKIVEEGTSTEVVRGARHPYAEALLRSSLLTPEPDGRLYAIPGGAPRPGELTAGCRFRARCLYANELGISHQCESIEPGLHSCSEGHHSARCWAVESGALAPRPIALDSHS